MEPLVSLPPSPQPLDLNERLVFNGYRVEDERSRAKYVSGQGIHAASKEEVPLALASNHEYMVLQYQILGHLHGRRPQPPDLPPFEPSPFISVFADWASADHEARRRAERGIQNVAVYHIAITGSDMREYGPIVFIFVPEALEWLNYPVPEWIHLDDVGNVYLFVHHIPSRCVRRRLPYWRKLGDLSFVLIMVRCVRSNCIEPGGDGDEDSYDSQDTGEDWHDAEDDNTHR
ncbi:hypothetical protein PABG_06530 [Paracoccidioides brasiliensis Pb03]|nr:hypothetical protein PABG_06530 [Paracoccidioides brasiliensis Pb03]